MTVQCSEATCGGSGTWATPRSPRLGPGQSLRKREQKATFFRWVLTIFAIFLSPAVLASPLVRCEDGQGGVTYTDQPCPAGEEQRRVAPPPGSRPRWEMPPPETRARIAAEAQVALEAQWQREVAVTLDTRGLRALNLTPRDVFWHLGTEERIAFIPASLPGNRIEPGRSLNLSGRGAPAGKVVVFYWWYKGDEIQPGSGIHGPDRVRRVLLQVPGAPTDRDRAKP